ncbi:hypothetical protein M3Y94_00966800 [Aphelenchoides besseyi]|nr:hypothetical protein M3Y94_00966800 [Aphelenchoides besseyi]
MLDQLPLIKQQLCNGKLKESPTSQTHIRNDIQTLRALAILFVLLFHMWPKRVAYGFWGVDMFFVISGYLMCLILSKKRPLVWSTISLFYFRRIKRIVPLYFFVILTTLIIVRRLISPIEFKQVVNEAIPALGFFSNIPNMREAAYFDISSKLFFFLHSWSLSCELQFYMIVPVIFVFFDLIDKFRSWIKFALISIIPIASFVYQCHASKDFAHMLLPSRIWQFFVGFAAYYLRKRRFFEFTANQSNVKETNKTNWINGATDVLLHTLLVLLLVYGLPMFPQLGRLHVVLITGIIVGSHNETFILSNWRLFVILGDISYSVYLIHWPLFTWYRYANSEVYVDGGEPDFITGITLIAVSIGLSHVVENTFKSLTKFIDGWTMLSLFVFFGLYLNGILLYNLRNSAIDLDVGLNADKKPEEWQQKIRSDVEMLWLTRTNPPNFTKDEVTRYNSEQYQAYNSFVFCDNQDRSMPTSYPLNMSSYKQNVVNTCHVKGNGTKNIVVIGNSHGMHTFAGISYIFRQTYKRLTLFVRNSCLPTSRKFQQPGRSEQDLDECMDLLNATAPALRGWHYPIDVVIALYALVDCPDHPLSTDMEKDEMYLTMKKFYGEIAEIPREALIVMQSNPIYSHVAIREVESRLKTGKPLDTIGDKPAFLRQQLSTLRTRMEYLECPKCLKMDLITDWCNRTHDNFCHSASPQGIVYFADHHHPSALGSFYNADLMHRMYRQIVG